MPQVVQRLQSLVFRLLPFQGRRHEEDSQEREQLGTLAAIACDASHLRRGFRGRDLKALLGSAIVRGEWAQVEPHLAALSITERAGGVNPGDRRALYALIRHFRPLSVLEVGTHIGASTVHIAAALLRNGAGRLTTVDILDVNDSQTKLWLMARSTHSPAEMVARLGAAELVRFVTQPSLEFLAGWRETFDFIFLDGDHAAQTVYQEIPAALRVLNPGGVVLLHDYFPYLQALWPDGVLIAGPRLAVQRLQAEGARLRMLPLDRLPWPTKQGTTVTSLALMVGTD
jgi:predicted O-methyltransferase YrrM